MRTTQQSSITLPNEMAEAIKAKVKTGEYATESEVIRAGLRTLLARDRAVDNWLHDQVGQAYDAFSGTRRDDIRPNLRITNYRKRTVIAFSMDAEQVSIPGVLYGGQDYETVLQEEP